MYMYVLKFDVRWTLWGKMEVPYDPYTRRIRKMKLNPHRVL